MEKLFGSGNPVNVKTGIGYMTTNALYVPSTTTSAASISLR